MERLTEKTVGCFEYALKDHKAVPGEFGTYDAFFDYSMAVKRLGHYEDTGLEPEDLKKAFNETAILKLAAQALSTTPDHLRDLLQAEQDGRLVVLPCKVGDSIYIPDLEKKIPVKVRVQGISISVSGRTILHFGGYPVECAWGDGCGKDWFLTREEAEAALAQKGGESDA